MTRALVVASLVAVLLIAIGVGSAALSQRFQLAAVDYEPIRCVPDAETKEKIRTILSEAVDQALRDHTVKMHEVWMRDDRGQPERARNGVRQGLKAFIGGHTFIKKWDPPLC